MEKTPIRFKFSGDLVDGTLIDASDGSSFHDGARQLLAMHAYFYTNGRLPKRGAAAHTPEYQVFEGPAREGCIELTYVVGLLAKGVITGIGVGGGKLLFDTFFADSLRGMLGSSTRPPFAIERNPVLEAMSGNRQPIIDEEREDIERWAALKHRVGTAMIGVMRPVGRSANQLSILVGQSSPITVTARDLDHLLTQRRLFLESQISLAVDHLRYRQAAAF